MSAAESPSISLSAAECERIVVIAEAFDRAYRYGAAVLESYLESAAGHFRRGLLQELLAIECEYRAARGETPTLADYRQRFPGDVDLVAAALQSVLDSEPASGETLLETVSEESTGVVVSSSSLREARMVGRYLIERELGRGGMGVVYLARQPGTDKPVALKLLLATANAELLARFRKEAKATSSIDSDHVVRILDVGEEDGQPYYVMPFVEGGQLEDLLADGPLPARRVAALLAPVARALAELHRLGILHRDLKPRNILYDSARDRALLTDFGLAKFRPDDEGATRSGAVFGTLRYMPPEQMRDAANVTASADIYSLGATLYHLATGRRPFEHLITEVELVRLIPIEDPAPARHLNPQVPRDIEAICQKCLEKLPLRRYRSADELADDLEAFVAGRPIVARPLSRTTRAMRWCNRNRLVTAFVSVLALSVLVIAVFFWNALDANNQLSKSNGQLTLTSNELSKRNDSYKQEVDKNRKLTDVAETGQYELQFERVRRAFQERRFGEMSHHHTQTSRTGFESQRLQYVASKNLPLETARLVEHDGAILDAELSPDGKRLATCATDGLVLIWDLATNRISRTLGQGRWSEQALRRLTWLEGWSEDMTWPPAAFCPVDVAWFPDGERLAIASANGEGLLIDVESGDSRRLVKDSDALYSVAVTGDGSRVLFGGRSGRMLLCDPRGDRSIMQSIDFGEPILTIRHDPAAGWLIGGEAGRLATLDTERLTTLAETSLTGAIWSFDVTRKGKQTLVVVGSVEPRLRLFELTAGDSPQWRLLDVFAVPSGDDMPRGIQAVRFGPTGDDVCAFDQQGRMFVWDRRTQRLTWATGDANTPRELQRNEQLAKNYRWPLPKPFERTGVIAAYRDAAADLEVIACNQVSGSRRYRCQSRLDRTRIQLPANSRIVFDGQRSEWLWCLSDDGRLRLVDSERGQVHDEVVAHSGQGNAITAQQGRDEVLTTGEDGAVRSWRATVAPPRIQRGTWDARHDAPLVSIALSSDGETVATVDAQARLLIWSKGDVRPAHSQAISQTAGRPRTGAVAFDKLNRRVAAFGAGSDFGLFSLRTFERCDSAPLNVHGQGLALLWNESEHHRDQFLASDEFSRIMIRDGFTAETLPFDGRQSEPCVAMTSSPDGQRLFLLTRDGRVLVHESLRYRSLLELDVGPAPATDLALDSHGRRLAVAASDGRVEILETQSPEAPPELRIVESSARWEAKTLLKETGRLYDVTSRDLALDANGRVALLVLRGQNQLEELALIRETDDGSSTELVNSDGLDLSSACHALFREGPRFGAVYRQRPRGSREPFEFALMVARQTDSAMWSHESAGPSGNQGRYPAPVVRNGKLAEILHHIEDGYYLGRTQQTSTGWQLSRLGRQGDGSRLRDFATSHGQPVFIYQSTRASAGASIFRLGWFEKDADHGDAWHSEAFDPTADSVFSATRLPDGTVAALGKRGESFRLFRRVSEDQWLDEPVPGRSQMEGALTCNAEGRLQLLVLREDKQQLVLYERLKGAGSDWSMTVIDNHLGQGWATLLNDDHSRPVVVAGHFGDRTATVRVYRRL